MTEAGKPAPTLKEVADKLRRGRSDMSNAFSNQKEHMLDEGYDLISDALKDLDSLASESEREQGALKELKSKMMARLFEIQKSKSPYHVAQQEEISIWIQVIDRLSPKAGGTGKEGE